MSDNISVGPKGTYEIYRAEGELLCKQGEYRKAAESYTMALEMKPEDKNCLVSRSKCYLQMGNAKLALEDAEKALAEDRDFNRGIACKAEALYHLGNFEVALVFYHRGHKLRPEQQEFRLGIQKSQEAIENSIGTPETVRLRSDGDLSFFWEAQQEDKPAKKKAGVGRYRKPGQQQAARQEKRKPKNHGNDKTIKQLLGQLYADREFLEKIYNDEAVRIQNLTLCEKCYKRTIDCRCHKFLIAKDDTRKMVEPYQVNLHSTRYRHRDPEVLNPEAVVPPRPSPEEKDKDSSDQNSEKSKKSRNSKQKENNNRMTKISATIQELALEGIDYLDSRTDFWRQQKPMYSRKRDKEMRDRDARRGSGKGARGDAAKYVLKNLEEIDQAQTDGRHEDALKQSRSVLKTVDKWSDEDLPNRQEVIANLHSCMGNSLLEKGEYEKSVKHHQKDLELAEEHDLHDAKSRAMDNLGRVYARMGKFEDAVEIWNDKVPLSKSALETTWLYHEIGRCHLELGQHEKAKDFGERSLAAAQEAEDNVWQLNASVLIAQAEVKCGDYQSAVDSFERSLEMAKAQGDTEAERAIKKALEDVNDKIVKGLKGEEDGEEKTDTDGKEQEEEDQAPDEDGYDQDFEGGDAGKQDSTVDEVQHVDDNKPVLDKPESGEELLSPDKASSNEKEIITDDLQANEKTASSPEQTPDEGTLDTDRTEDNEGEEKKEKTNQDEEKEPEKDALDDNANETVQENEQQSQDIEQKEEDAA